MHNQIKCQIFGDIILRLNNYPMIHIFGRFPLTGLMIKDFFSLCFACSSAKELCYLFIYLLRFKIDRTEINHCRCSTRSRWRKKRFFDYTCEHKALFSFHVLLNNKMILRLREIDLRKKLKSFIFRLYAFAKIAVKRFIISIQIEAIYFSDSFFRNSGALKQNLHSNNWYCITFLIL